MQNNDTQENFDSNPPSDINQVIFLDIDGVLNSTRSIIAFGGSPMSFTKSTWYRSDDIAVRLIRGISRKANAPIVLSSAWRAGPIEKIQDLAKFFDLNIIDRTGNELGVRGQQIAAWLQRHPDVNNYVIIDDDADMLDEQKSRFVHTDHAEGFSFANLTQACKILHISPYGINHPRNGVKKEQPIGATYEPDA